MGDICFWRIIKSQIHRKMPIEAEMLIGTRVNLWNIFYIYFSQSVVGTDKIFFTNIKQYPRAVGAKWRHGQFFLNISLREKLENV